MLPYLHDGICRIGARSCLCGDGLAEEKQTGLHGYDITIDHAAIGETKKLSEEPQNWTQGEKQCANS